MFQSFKNSLSTYEEILHIKKKNKITAKATGSTGNQPNTIFLNLVDASEFIYIFIHFRQHENNPP